jgi:hypothetical protein
MRRKKSCSRSSVSDTIGNVPLALAHSDPAYLGPDEFFPGQPPYRKYILQLRTMQQKAIECGISSETFKQACNQFARVRSKDQTEDFDLKQYKTEKALWEHFCKNSSLYVRHYGS